MNSNNIFFNCDSYKISHYNMYPENTTKVYSYVESRGGELENTVFFGLQFLIQRLNSFFPTMDDVEEAKTFFDAHGEPFNYEGAKALVELGYFPLEIKAVKEGTVMPTKNILVSITNTLPEFAWLPSLLETILLNGTWYPTTVASYSRACKKIIEQAYDKTASEESKAGIPFAMHDFGFRGTSSIETAGIGGTAHLVNFVGSDTVIANVYAKKFYDCDIASFSVPAAEHSTITAWGRECEREAYKNIIEQYPDGIVSVVSDSYDIYHAVDYIYGVELKDRILERDGVYVVRPDSGDPVTVLCGTIKSLDSEDIDNEDVYWDALNEGYLYVEIDGEVYSLNDGYFESTGSLSSPLKDINEIREAKGILRLLWDRFGGKKNEKGYRVLDDKIRVLQGDGINIHSLEIILDELERFGWSAENMVFGMGGKLLQDHNRDTMKFACKCSYVEIDDEGRDVFKSPKTDTGKASKKGIMSLIKDGNEYKTVKGEHVNDLLEVVYIDGEVTRRQSLQEIRDMVG